MRPRSLGAAVAAALLLTTSTARAAPDPGAEYVVVLHDAADPATVASQHGLSIDHAYKHALTGFSGRATRSQAASLTADSQVQFVAGDRLLQFSEQVVPTGIARIGAAPLATRSSRPVDVDVAIVDTGIDPTHPDLNVVGGVNCVNQNKTWADDAGHGTLMAGVAAARDNGIGVVGVAPGARLWSVKVGGPKGAKMSDVICGLDWLAAQGGAIKVASLSLSGVGTDDRACGAVNKDALHKAVCRAAAAGVTVVVAAGNDGLGLDSRVPAAYDEVLTVTAMTDYDGRPGGLAPATCLAGVDDSVPSWSNYAVAGTRDAAHTIAAPGVCIESTAMGGGYAVSSGTSPATPHVAATVARCLASGACRGLTPPGIVDRIRADAARQPRSYGFVGDPSRPISVAGVTHYYGHLVYAGGY